MGAPPVLRQIEVLDPVRDHQRIVRLTLRTDFPFDATRALELALFRTFAVPRIAALLDRTGEFTSRTQQRYDDTDLLISGLIEHGYDSDRGGAALRRMNEIHGRFDIPNDDLLYVLSTFVFEPIRWIGRFGWRRLVPKERLAIFLFWREVGRRMGIKDLPETYEAFETFNRRFERERFRFSLANHRVARATLEMMCDWFPSILRPLVRRGMLSVMDEPLLTATGFGQPPAWFRRIVLSMMRARSVLLGVLPRRRRPLLRTEMRHRTYPGGYRVDTLGPPPSPPRQESLKSQERPTAGEALLEDEDDLTPVIGS